MNHGYSSGSQKWGHIAAPFLGPHYIKMKGGPKSGATLRPQKQDPKNTNFHRGVGHFLAEAVDLFLGPPVFGGLGLCGLARKRVEPLVQGRAAVGDFTLARRSRAVVTAAFPSHRRPCNRLAAPRQQTTGRPNLCCKGQRRRCLSGCLAK